jgi:hypothetical protein
MPIQHWRVGLASRRRSAARGSAARAEPADRADIHREPDRREAARRHVRRVYDNTTDPDAIGFTWSSDGRDWSAGQSLVIQPSKGSGA